MFKKKKIDQRITDIPKNIGNFLETQLYGFLYG